MPRKHHGAITPEVTPEPLPESHQITLAEQKLIKQIELDQLIQTMQDVGAMRALDFIRKISGRVQVELYLKLKETKGWKFAPHPESGKFSDLDEFCEAYLGESGRSIRNKVQHYHLLGPALMEVSERIGFKPRDYAALKALPADDQETIKLALQADDRNQVIDLLQEMAARHASEKAELTAKTKEAEETAEARSAVIERKESRINSLEEETHKLRRRLETATPDEIGADLRQETAGIGWSLVGRINTDLAEAFKALDAHARENDCTHEDFMSGVLLEIDCALGAIRERYAIKMLPDGDQRPEWVREGFGETKDDPLKEARERFKAEHGYDPAGPSKQAA